MASLNANEERERAQLSRITVREPGTRLGSFKPGDIGQPIPGRHLWYLSCPACGWGTYVGRTHQVMQNKDGTVTITPAMVCPGHRRRFDDPHRCSARYRIDHNIIFWQPRTSGATRRGEVKKP